MPIVPEEKGTIHRRTVSCRRHGILLQLHWHINDITSMQQRLVADENIIEPDAHSNASIFSITLITTQEWE